jgi:hypothetical protein
MVDVSLVYNTFTCSVSISNTAPLIAHENQGHESHIPALGLEFCRYNVTAGRI